MRGSGLRTPATADSTKASKCGRSTPVPSSSVIQLLVTAAVRSPRARMRRTAPSTAGRGPCADPEFAIRVAVAAEEAGFESVWTGEHVAMPIRDNPVPTPAETPILDSLVALANVAVHTRRLRLGTGILVLPHHNPVLLAKALTTLDLVSGGRLIAGAEAGYVQAEVRALGVSFEDRGAITDEYLEAIRVIRTDELPRV